MKNRQMTIGADERAGIAILVNQLVTEAGLDPVHPVTLKELIEDACEPLMGGTRRFGSAGIGEVGSFEYLIARTEIVVETVLLVYHTGQLVTILRPKVAEIMGKLAKKAHEPDLIVLVLEQPNRETAVELPAEVRADIASRLDTRISAMNQPDAVESLRSIAAQLEKMADILKRID